VKRRSAGSVVRLPIRRHEYPGDLDMSASQLTIAVIAIVIVAVIAVREFGNRR
jgi:hypothetical protein